MSVELDPVELGFRRPFTREVAETLRLRNPSSDPVAFKVKTTAPKKYAVRPNSGRIDGGQVVEVQVLLQAMKEDPPEGEKCRDKFLVQSVPVSGGEEFSNIAALWANIESTSKSSIQEKKIRVNWLSQGDVGTPVTATRTKNSLHTGDSTPAHYTDVVTPRSERVKTDGATEANSSRMSGTNHVADASSESSTAAAGGQQSAIGAAIATVTNALPSADDVKSQLADAQATIANLTKQIQEQGLRQRKPDNSSSSATERASSGSTTTVMHQAAPNGVPVPIVAALCLLSFLIAYLLF